MLCLCLAYPSCILLSIATPTYNKEAALVQDKQNQLRLVRVGEAVLSNGSWLINNERVCHTLSYPLLCFDSLAWPPGGQATVPPQCGTLPLQALGRLHQREVLLLLLFDCLFVSR